MSKIDEIKFWQGTEEEYENGSEVGFYNWKSGSGELGEWVESSLPSSRTWQSVTYGNGKFVAVAAYSNVCAYSEDGINWTQGTMPSSPSWQSVTYGNGKFVVITNGANICAYSTDGITWTKGTMPSSQSWQSVTYGNGKFVAIVTNASNVCAYSTDGINWTEGTMPSDRNWSSITYGNDKFVAVVYRSDIFAYSTDGITWTKGTMPSSQSWQSVTYGNGKFVAIATNASDVCAYSTDGINWTQGTMPSSQYWEAVAYGNGKFVVITNGDNICAYSDDGINWTTGTMPSSRNWTSVVYGANKFVTVADSSYVSAYLPYSSLQCYTDTTTPTTSSTVYSAPATESSLTITSVGDNSITLSDDNTYDRNSSGDVETKNNIGQDHPDYVCYINETGIKVADKFIAKKSPNKYITLNLTPGDTSYGWQATTVTNPTSYTMVESTNKSVDSSYSVMKVVFFGYSTLTLYINSYAESTYDYTVASKIDAASYPTDYSSSTAYENTRGKQYDPTTFNTTNWTTVTYTDIPEGEHYVYIVYRKDSSAAGGNDRGYLIIDENQ